MSTSFRHGCCKSLYKHERASMTNTNRHVWSCWSRCKSLHKHKHECITNTSTHATETPLLGGSRGGPRLLSSGILGGSLFCSWTCPGQGSHTAVLDGSLFEEAQGGHTFWARTTWSGNTRGLKPEPTTNDVAEQTFRDGSLYRMYRNK